MPDRIDKALKKLAALIAAERFENVEDDGLEIKPTPSATSSWREKFAFRKVVSEPEVILALWHEHDDIQDADEPDSYLQRVMGAFATLKEVEFIVYDRDHSGFVLNFGPIRQATR